MLLYIGSVCIHRHNGFDYFSTAFSIKNIHSAFMIYSQALESIMKIHLQTASTALYEGAHESEKQMH